MITLPVGADSNQQGVLKLLGRMQSQVPQEGRPGSDFGASRVSMKETQSLFRDDHVKGLPGAQFQGFLAGVGREDLYVHHGLLQPFGKEREKDIVWIYHQNPPDLVLQQAL